MKKNKKPIVPCGTKTIEDLFLIYKNEFTENKAAVSEYMDFYGELLGHVFFGEFINVPLYELLKENTEHDKIRKYCSFIEKMWRYGNEEVINIVDVTVLERLSDDVNVWKNFGKYISNDFIRYINTVSVPNNLMICKVERLEYN